MHNHGFLNLLPALLLSLMVSYITTAENDDSISPLAPVNRRHFGIIIDSTRNSTNSTRLNWLIKNVSHKVSNVIIFLDTYNENNVLQTQTANLVSATAENNKRENPLKTQLFIRHKIGQHHTDTRGTSSDSDFITRFKSTVSKAYSSYANTDVYVVVDVNDANPATDAPTVGMVLHATKAAIPKGSSNFKVGIGIGITNCVDNSKLIKWLKHLHPTPNVLLLDSSFFMEGTECPADVTFECYFIKMNKCKEKLNLAKYQMDIIFKTGPPPHSSLNAVALNLFWKWVNLWAVAANATVLVNEASVMGLIQTNSSNNSQHITAPKSIGNGNVTKIGLGAEHLSGNSSSLPNVSFSSTYFGVRFFPRVKQSDDDTSYEEQDLLPFVELISTRFSNIITRPLNKTEYDAHSSNIHVSSAVARFNQRSPSDAKMGKPRKPLKVFMQFALESAHDINAARINSTPTPFEVVKGLADHANFFFNGTVPYLLLFETHFKMPMLTSVLNQLEFAQHVIHTKTTGSTYQLGVFLRYTDCETVGTDTDYVTPVLQKVSLAVFSLLLERSEVHLNSEEFYTRYTSLMKLCINRMTKSVPNVEIGFNVGWPDTDFWGGRNATRLTWFWRELNSWAVENKILLLMDSAFDDPHDSYRSKMGWWRLVEDRACYSSTREYTFQEKILEPEDNTNNVDSTDDIIGKFESESGGVITFKLAMYNVTYDRSKEDNHHQLKKRFSGRYFGVFMHPYVLDGLLPASYSKQNVNFLLKIVRTRFANLMIPPITEESLPLKESHVYIPTEAARLNRYLFNTSAKHQDTSFMLNSVSKPLKVVIPVTYEIRGGSEEPLRSSLEDAYKLAAEANSISPNTVPFILVDIELDASKDTSGLQTAGSLMKRLKQKIEPGIKLGVSIESVMCRPDNFLSGTKLHLLPHAELLLLYFQDDNHSNEMKTITQRIFREFEACKQSLATEYPDLEVGIFSEWEDTKEETIKNPYNLLQFWEEMNKYAVETQTLVFLRDAFDQGSQVKQSGWWRIVRDGGKYVVQEKYQVYNTDEKKSAWLRTGVPETKVLIYVGVTVLVVATVAIVIGLMFLRRVRRNARFMTENEIREFFGGVEKSKRSYSKGSGEESNYFDVGALVEQYAYDGSLEIGKDSFVLDETSTLGSGAFGIVCLGKIQKDDSLMNTAVKRVKLDGSDGGLCSLRSLLSEIKVLSYIGRHENIVVLLGANTEDIRKGDVYAFLELSALGSLEKYIRNLRNSNKIADGDYLVLEEEEPEESENLSSLLLRWSKEIASGMEYLSSKHVVHADLATRNVLLDSRKTAKICDFGLSRRMLNYQSYVKTRQEPLPWRWMAPESLGRFFFTEKSDVWSFGVTLWEMYTFGNVPYAGLSWNIDFVSQLEEGLRLPNPRNEQLSPEIVRSQYEIMLQCWELDTMTRPSFKQLKIMLQGD